MVDFGGAIKKPFTDNKKLVIGFIVGLIPVVQLLNFGFGLSTAQRKLNGDDSLSEWGDIGGIIVKTIMAIVVGIIYMIPALIFGAIALTSLFPVIMSLLVSGTADPNVIFQSIAGAGAMVIIAAVLFIAAAFVLPMALMHYLKGGFSAAFSFGSVIRKALTGKYILSWIVVIVYGLVWSVIGLGLGAVTAGIGTWIVAGIASYALAITEYSIFAQTY